MTCMIKMTILSYVLKYLYMGIYLENKVHEHGVFTQTYCWQWLYRCITKEK